jgi:acyl-CoA thioesterase-1
VAQQGFIPQMQSWLEEQGQEVTLINGGVSGDTTTGGLARISWSLTPEVDGLIIALGGNDLLRGIDPGLSRRNLAGILEVATVSEIPVLLVGIHVPNNYGPEYKQLFEAIYPDLAERYDTLLADNFLAGLYDNPDDGPASVLRFLQADGLHPNSAGVTRIVHALGPRVEDLIARLKQKRASSQTPAKKP